MVKQRLDQILVVRKFVETRSQAENLIRLGEVQVNNKVITKSGYFVSTDDELKVTASERYVSRAGLKLASIAQEFCLNFKDKVVLDVGSSTGGFTDYALQHGAKKVIAVDVGTDQLHARLRNSDRIELHEQTDIRRVNLLSTSPNIVVIDVSFISIKEVLVHISKIVNNAQIVAMVKPQFEIGTNAKHKGVIKNERIRRDVLKDFEVWVKHSFIISNKMDSKIIGAKGNRERFYLLKIINKN